MISRMLRRGFSRLQRITSSTTSGSSTRLVPASERPLGISAPKPPRRYARYQVSTVRALSRTSSPSGFSCTRSADIAK